ncbi:tail protein X [Dichelobacter nodosus]|uniref:tail protein X n=1 Tax=Dichelobacter nodosus TaxID=870 RepID=UPI00068045E9|nr:tail protein X [Dichelobacter nodosus]KNZ39966.1 hypothetical protein AKG33_01065 [Dichelobacter nodosus]
MNVTTRQNDTLDEVCYRVFGRTDMIVAVIESNPHALNPAQLQAGVIIELPDLLQAAPAVKSTLKLWD